MSHLHRGRFIRLRHDKNEGGDGAAVLNREQVSADAAPAAPVKAKAKRKRKAKRAR